MSDQGLARHLFPLTTILNSYIQIAELFNLITASTGNDITLVYQEGAGDPVPVANGVKQQLQSMSKSCKRVLQLLCAGTGAIQYKGNTAISPCNYGHVYPRL